MADNSVNDLLLDQKSFFHSLLSLRDELDEHLSRSLALSCIANSEDFLDFNDEIIRNYLSILESLVNSSFETYLKLDKLLGEIH